MIGPIQIGNAGLLVVLLHVIVSHMHCQYGMLSSMPCLFFSLPEAISQEDISNKTPMSPRIRKQTKSGYILLSMFLNILFAT